MNDIASILKLWDEETQTWTNIPAIVGAPGKDGEDGYTPVKGTDYFDGEDGSDGATFVPSVSADGVLSWANNGGLENPASVNIKGADGYTPVKGTDYFTPADVEEIATAAAAKVEIPEGGSSATQYTGTLTSDGWADDGNGYYSQTITITGLKATYPVSPDFDCEQTGTDAEADIVVANAFDKVSFASTGANSLTAKCSGDAPTSNIPIIVRVFE